MSRVLSRVYYFPSGRHNFTKNERAKYHGESGTAWIYRFFDSNTEYRAGISYGGLSQHRIGDYVSLYHDQTGRYMGRGEIVGAVTSVSEADGALYSVGFVPNKTIAYGVYK